MANGVELGLYAGDSVIIHDKNVDGNEESGYNRWFHWMYIVDWVLCVICFCVPLVFKYFITPFQMYMVPDDPTQSYPHSEGDRVPVWVLGVITWSPPFITTLYQLIYYQIYPIRRAEKLHILHHTILGWAIGHALDAALSNAIKFTGGRHRPDYIARMETEGLDDWQIKNACLSFPSGHTSGSFTAMIFLFWFFAAKTKVFQKNNFFCVLAVVGIPLYFATWVGLSRVQDYRHNYSDVLAGALLGMICGSLGYFMHFFSPAGPNPDKPKNRYDEASDF